MSLMIKNASVNSCILSGHIHICTHWLYNRYNTFLGQARSQVLFVVGVIVNSLYLHCCLQYLGTILTAADNLA